VAAYEVAVSRIEPAPAPPGPDTVGTGPGPPRPGATDRTGPVPTA
jgi:hypothetical protein